MEQSPITLDLTIKRLESPAQAEVCAQMMATSEPWLTLGRGYDPALRLLTDPTREVYLAWAGAEIVGFIILVMHGAFVGYLQSIAVAPPWRGRGIGTALLRFAEERVFCDSPNLFLCVSSFNAGAQALYQREGYAVVGTFTDYLVSGHDEILMRKTLGPWRTFVPRREEKTA